MGYGVSRTAGLMGTAAAGPPRWWGRRRLRVHPLAEKPRRWNQRRQPIEQLHRRQHQADAALL